VVDEGDRHVTFAFSTPYLIGATPPTTSFGASTTRAAPTGWCCAAKARCQVSVSTDRGRTWHDAGAFADGMDLTDHVKAQRQYRLRFGAGAKELASSGLTVTTVCQANAAILPRLKDGGSSVRFEASGRTVASAGPTWPRPGRTSSRGLRDAERYDGAGHGEG